MGARFVNINQDTPLLLPPDLRARVSPEHPAHFIMDAAGELDLRGKAGAALEWTLVALAYNLRRLGAPLMAA